MNSSYWIEYRQPGERSDIKGAGFLISRHYALTALHRLNDVATDGDQLEILLDDGQEAMGRVSDRSREADLAIIFVAAALNIVVPIADRACNGDSWRSPYRPSTADIYLDGRVTEAALRYQCSEGEIIDAVQLECYQSVASYHGYSGGPVERTEPEGRHATVGILIEQYPFLDEEGSRTASNVLIAASLTEVFRRFSCFSPMSLLNFINRQGNDGTGPSCEEALPERHASSASANPDAARVGTHRVMSANMAGADAKLEALRDWARRGLINEQYALRLSRKVLRTFIDE